MSKKEDIALYKAKGAKAFVERLPEMIKECLEDEPIKSFMYFCSDLCIDLEKYDIAIEILNKIDLRFSLCDIGYNNRGYSYGELNKQKLQIQDYLKSIELNPKSKSSLRNLAYIDYLSEGKTPIEWTKYFYDQYPEVEESCLWYATSLWNHDFRVQAFEFVKEILSKHPDFSELVKLNEDLSKIGVQRE